MIQLLLVDFCSFIYRRVFLEAFSREVTLFLEFRIVSEKEHIFQDIVIIEVVNVTFHLIAHCSFQTGVADGTNRSHW